MSLLMVLVDLDFNPILPRLIIPNSLLLYIIPLRLLNSDILQFIAEPKVNSLLIMNHIYQIT